jgi:hypothetical protein
MEMTEISEQSMKHMHELGVLGAIGGSVYDYFCDSGIRKLALYGNDELVAMLYELAYWKGIEIERVFGEEEREYAVNFNVASVIKKIRQEKSESPAGIPVILCGKPKKPMKNTFLIGDLCSYSRTKHLLFDKIKAYRSSIAPNLKVIVFELPSLWFTRNKSEYERTLLKTPSKNNLSASLNTLHLMGKDDEYIESVNRGAHTVQRDGTFFLADFKSKYCNYVGGYRLTTDVPANVDRTIYTFGNSVAFGMKSDDEHTIQSVCQRELNQHFGESPAKILNCANYGHPNIDKIWTSFQYHEPDDTDVVVLMSYFSNLLYDIYKDDFLFVKPQKDDGLFNRPHNLGEYVFLDAFHYSHIGYTELGKYLARKMIDNGVLTTASSQKAQMAPPRMSSGRGGAATRSARARFVFAGNQARRAEYRRDCDELQPLHTGTPLSDRAVRPQGNVAYNLCCRGRQGVFFICGQNSVGAQGCSGFVQRHCSSKRRVYHLTANLRRVF